MRRALPLLLALAAAALIAAGCGGSSSGSTLGDELAYLPKGSPVVVAIKTDPNDPQFKNIGKLVDKFPFASQIKQRFQQGLTSQSGSVNYEKDIKPLLGNDLVVAIPPGTNLSGGRSNSPYVVAWQTKGGDVKKLAERGNARKVGSEDGATIYQEADGSASALKGKTIVAAKTRALLDSALRGHDASGHLTEADFNSALGSVSKNALVRVEGNLQTLIAQSPGSAKALQVPWVKSLRTFGAAVSTASDGIAVDFDVKTEGIAADQQPLATGSAPAPVVRRPGEVGIGLRSPSQVVKFIESVVSITNPKSLLNKDKVGKNLGVDIDRDVVAQLGGDSAVSVALDGKAAARADLKDPAAFKKTLATIMKNLPKAQRAQGGPVSSVKNGPNGLYTVTKPGHSPTVVGVIGKVVVVASDAQRAQEIAGESASAVPGTKGALVLTADPKSIVSEALKKQGNSGAALILGPALSAHLESLNGSVESEAGGLTGDLKLTIK